MNARLMNTTPESLQRQADTCSAACRLLLDSSGRYFDIQFGAMRNSLNRLRDHLDDAGLQVSDAAFRQYSATINASLADAGDFMRQSGGLLAEMQRGLGALLEQGWQHQKVMLQQATEAQLALARSVGQAMVRGEVAR